MGGVDVGLVLQVARQPLHRVPLVVRETLGELGLHQVGTPHCAVEHRPAGEDGSGVDAGPAGTLDGVGDVVRSVSRGGDDGHRQVTDDEGVPVANGRVVERNVRVGRNQVRGSVALSQLETTGDVVVVHVRLDDVGHEQTVLGHQVLDPVDVALRVDHHGMLPVVGDVAAVAEPRGLDHEDVWGAGVGHELAPSKALRRPHRLVQCRRGIRLMSRHAVPPVTLVASMPR